jgi:hypothetical protein
VADGSFGARDIVLDLAGVITARVLRNALLNEHVKVVGVTINGVAPATGSQGTIELRQESASGPVVWQLVPANTETLRSLFSFPGTPGSGRIYKGLYMAAMVAGWGAGSTMILHTS